MTEILLLTIITLSLFILISNHPIYCLFCLILTFINFSILLILFNLEFLALSYVIVYVGAICVLFIFVILLLNIRVYNLSSRKNLSMLTTTLLISGLLSVLLINSDTEILDQLNNPGEVAAHNGGLLLFGKSFFDLNWEYLILTTLLLLLAVIATIAVSLKKKENNKVKFDFFY